MIIITMTLAMIILISANTYYTLPTKKFKTNAQMELFTLCKLYLHTFRETNLGNDIFLIQL